MRVQVGLLGRSPGPPRVGDGGGVEGREGGRVHVSPAMANEARKCVIVVTDLSFPAANLHSVRPRAGERLGRKNVLGRKKKRRRRKRRRRISSPAWRRRSSRYRAPMLDQTIKFMISGDKQMLGGREVQTRR